MVEAQDDLQTPEESENPETAVESEEQDNSGDSENQKMKNLNRDGILLMEKNITQMEWKNQRQAG